MAWGHTSSPSSSPEMNVYEFQPGQSYLDQLEFVINKT